MEQQTTIIILFIITIFSCVGFAVSFHYFIKKIKSLTKPRTPLRADKKKVEQFSKLVKDFSFEEKLFCIRTLLGNCILYIRVEGDTIVIDGVGRLPHETDKGIDYTG